MWSQTGSRPLAVTIGQSSRGFRYSFSIVKHRSHVMPGLRLLTPFEKYRAASLEVCVNTDGQISQFGSWSRIQHQSVRPAQQLALCFESTTIIQFDRRFSPPYSSDHRLDLALCKVSFSGGVLHSFDGLFQASDQKDEPPYFTT